MMSAQQLREAICGACGKPLNRCLRIVGMPLPGDELWMCEGCWHPKDEHERAQYRELYPILPMRELACCICSRPAPIEEVVTAYFLQQQAENKARRDSKSASLSKLKEEIRDGKISFVRSGKRRHILDAEINRYLLRNTS